MVINKKNAHLINSKDSFKLKNVITKEVKTINRNELSFICNKYVKNNDYKTWDKLIEVLQYNGFKVSI